MLIALLIRILGSKSLNAFPLKFTMTPFFRRKLSSKFDHLNYFFLMASFIPFSLQILQPLNFILKLNFTKFKNQLSKTITIPIKVFIKALSPINIILQRHVK